jgi:cell division protein DivIC
MMKALLKYHLKRKRKFVFIGLAFLIWMLFFDNRNVFVQKSLNHQIHQLELEYDLYQGKLVKVQREYDAMQEHPEKYAREKYFMHKANEEVFIYTN